MNISETLDRVTYNTRANTPEDLAEEYIISIDEQIEHLISRPTYYKIIFQHESYGAVFVVCTIYRNQRDYLPVSKTGKSREDAFDKTLRLLDAINYLEKTKKLDYPHISKQSKENGYYRETLFGINLIRTEIEYKNIGGKFAITDLCQIDNNDFYLVDIPYDVPDHFVKIDDRDGYTKNGEELYTWDTISCLSGSSGFAVVKDGKVIRNKTVMIS